MSKFVLRRLNHQTGNYEHIFEADTQAEAETAWNEKFPHSHHVILHEDLGDGKSRFINGTSSDFDSHCYRCQKQRHDNSD